MSKTIDTWTIESKAFCNTRRGDIRVARVGHIGQITDS